MSDDWSSNIVPWRPPDGFVNPVPPARGERSTYRAQASRGAADDAVAYANTPRPVPQPTKEEASRSLKWLKVGIGLIVAIAILGGPVIAAIEDGIESATDSIEKEIDKQTGDTQTSDPKPAADADGVSDLPGGYASVSYNPRDGMVESATRKDIDAPYDGSTWFLSDPGKGWAMLGHYTFVPAITSEAQQEDFIARNKEQDEQIAGDSIRPRQSTVDGRPAWDYTYRTPRGERRSVTWVLGPEHSYTLRCNADDASFVRQCRGMRRSLSVSR